MAVSTAYAPLTYNGNGATTAFPVTWPFFATTDLVVVAVSATGVETTQTNITHYAVTGGTDSDGLPATGTVTMVTAPASSTMLRISRATPKLQASEWSRSGSFSAKTLEAALDRLTLISQEAGSGGGAIFDGITGDVMTLDGSGAVDIWDAESHPIRNVADAVDGTDAVPYAQLSALLAAVVSTAFGTFRTSTGSTTVANGEHVIMANTSAAVVTIASGVDWCAVSRSDESTEDVTVISADTPTQTVMSVADGVIINSVAGPVLFAQDPLVATNFITVVPAGSGGSSSSAQPWVGNLTVAALGALVSPAQGSGGFATNGRKNGEGASSGTGVQVFYDGTAWRACDTGATVAA